MLFDGFDSLTPSCKLVNCLLVQSLNSPFFPPFIGAEPGRAKRFARPGSAPIRGGKEGEFRDWTNYLLTQYKVLSIDIMIDSGLTTVATKKPRFFRKMHRIVTVYTQEFWSGCEYVPLIPLLCFAICACLQGLAKRLTRNARA